MQAELWTAAAGSLVLVGVSAFADGRRARRRDLDRAGWVPWPLIMILAMIVAAVTAALALRG